MGEGTGEEKIRREDGDGKVRLGECSGEPRGPTILQQKSLDLFFFCACGRRLFCVRQEKRRQK